MITFADIAKSLSWLVSMLGITLIALGITDAIIPTGLNYFDVSFGVFAGWFMYDGTEMVDGLWKRFVLGEN